MNDKDKALLHDRLLIRYPDEGERSVVIREFIEGLCVRHIDSDLGDRDILDKLCSPDDARYWQQLSEVLLANELMNAGVELVPSHEGPDVLFRHEGRNIWIEVICPEPTGVPADWLERPSGKAISFPHEAILLRWTAAIKEKGEKLLGNAGTGARGYLTKGVVKPEDSYVIAVNARRLRGPHFASITGISQFPSAVEAAFAVGPMSVTIDRDSLKAVGSGHQHRPMIRKPNGAEVPVYTFLDSAFSAVSAIWAADIDETWVIGNMKALAVVHNPGATAPLGTDILPAFQEFVASLEDADTYALETRDGILAGH